MIKNENPHQIFLPLPHLSVRQATPYCLWEANIFSRTFKYIQIFKCVHSHFQIYLNIQIYSNTITCTFKYIQICKYIHSHFQGFLISTFAFICTLHNFRLPLSSNIFTVTFHDFLFLQSLREINLHHLHHLHHLKTKNIKGRPWAIKSSGTETC